MNDNMASLRLSGDAVGVRCKMYIHVKKECVTVTFILHEHVNIQCLHTSKYNKLTSFIQRERQETRELGLVVHTGV
jgi:hypothetical protein